MKKSCFLFISLILVFFLLTACGGVVNQNAVHGKQGDAAARFDTFSKLAGIEKGISVIEVYNELQTPVVIKITIPENETAWKLFEIPPQSVLPIELGTMPYWLQVQPEHGSSNELYLRGGDISVAITNDPLDQYRIFIPQE